MVEEVVKSIHWIFVFLFFTQFFFVYNFVCIAFALRPLSQSLETHGSWLILSTNQFQRYFCIRMKCF